MASVDDELLALEEEYQEVQKRLQAARQKKALTIIDVLDDSVDVLGDLVDYYDLLDDAGRARVAKFHGRVQERFSAMGLQPSTEVKRPKTSRPLVELKAQA